jgi:hypothetical protein
METINISEAKSKFSEYLSRAASDLLLCGVASWR